jgi:mannose-6-phosphate isomerase-like protein (cupin superfamily)
VQLGEPTRPQDLCDPQLGRPGLNIDSLLEPPSLGGESDHPGPSVGRIRHAPDIPLSFKVPEKVVDRPAGSSRVKRFCHWGSAPPLHVHDDLDDTWYILEGRMVVRCGDEALVVGAGHWVSMPRGVPHTFRVVGVREARILLVHDNPSFRDLIRALGTPATARVVPNNAMFPPWTTWSASLRPTISGLSGLL